MAVEMWLTAALVIVATVCIGLGKDLFVLPIVGDTVSYLVRGPREFVLDRLARHGDPFTVSCMGIKRTVVSSPGAIKFVLSTAHSSFALAYDKAITKLLGEDKLADSRHPHFRKAMLSAFQGDGLQSVLPFISSLAEKTVKSWEHQAAVNTSDELQKFVFKVAMHFLWRDIEPDTEEMEQIRQEMFVIAGGLLVAPINLPGFNYHKALKARQVVASRIQSAISKRREAGSEENDFMNVLLSMREVEVPDNDVSSILVSIMFAASATSAALIPWVLKYLHDFPQARQRVQDEQDGIRQKMIEDKSLTWFKAKSSMPYTLQVIYEVMRIEAFAPFVQRQVTKDVDYNGFVFRKGSYVWASMTSIQYSPEYYPNPRHFDPSRFAEKPKPNAFFPFGQGPHLCPGSDVALTETLFLIHHLVTNYSWEICGRDQRMERLPFWKIAGGFPIRLVKRCTT